MFKRIALFLSVCLVPLLSFAVDNKPFVGQISAADLLNDHQQFSNEYNNFVPTVADTQAMQTLKGKDILVLFGTWCHDSQREVPRLLKLLDSSKVALASLKLVAVGYDKRDPEGIAARYQLKYSPTIIVLTAGEELGRLVEKPKASIASDLSQFNPVTE
ncbi:thioredoxin family protein [Pseudoalteromonas sp. SG43-7]|jgi:thioredoxin 1|uniref:Thioredoxin family protein n=1 Tax=Pseudoalteromonas neustonica TaxID=1840331 RepID=A0ABY3FBN3_9GAMM|nr:MULTISPECIES: thioredoxin family protein [Pseudoalteromonas]MBB1334331.1 thioredoxin family protein [Pseudoalteromonas sp. SR41-6]MBB1417637.1 thioredoxin family protein [Pseudoalteromonas sp. SG44-1]MBB1424404.1 thioredoxin family protein [Pseudoalteromonas sp. SG43-7]MBB1433871.1 thioredoxin family protein [Pseudoalteromonas sp. SG43-6]MBB1459890.1 thioredoxin family protein [Pseudoalteromonas sp. SG41-8]